LIKVKLTKSVLLFKYGGDITLQVINGQTALHHAVYLLARMTLIFLSCGLLACKNDTYLPVFQEFVSKTEELLWCMPVLKIMSQL
jgi:hypothetical protein